MSSASLWRNFFAPKDEQKTLRKLLQQVFVFRDLNSRDLRLILELMHERVYGPNEVVFFEGQPGSGMYIIISGEVRVVLNYGRANELELLRLQSEDFFGELSLIDEAPRSATIVTTTRTHLGGFFRPDLLDFIQRNPRQGVRILLNLSEVLAERLRRTTHELRDARQALEEQKN